MNTPIARSSVVTSRYRYESASSQTNDETAVDVLENGTWRTSIVCMPMTNVWARTPSSSSVVAARPTEGLALREMNRVHHDRGGVQSEGKQVQRAVGA